MLLAIRDRIVIGVLSIALVLLTPLSHEYALAQQESQTYERDLANVELFFELVHEMRDTLDATQFDVDALSLQLAFEEPETIVDWVTDEIVFEPYDGLLRGPRGTLMSRAGNALDQSVLLARLLNDAGYEARIARTNLDTDQASAVIEAGANQEARYPPMANMSDLREVVSEIASIGGGDHVRSVEVAMEAIQSHIEVPDSIATFAIEEANAVMTSLAHAGLRIGSTAEATESLDRPMEYFYVEYRVGSEDAWAAAHPANPGWTSRSPALTPLERFEGAVPQEFLHTIGIQVVNERKLGDALEETPLFEPWIRPAANLAGVPLTYTNVPGNADDLLLSQDTDTLAEAEYLVPVFNGEPSPGGQVFDLEGNMVDQEAINNQAAGVFRNIGNAFGDATGALSNPSSPEDALALTAQWLEVTLTSPHGDVRTYRRTIFDALGSGIRDADNLAEFQAAPTEVALQELSARHSILVATGAFPPAFVLDVVLGKLLDLKVPMKTLVALKHQQLPADVSDHEVAAMGIAWSGLVPLISMFDAPLSGQRRAPFRVEPHVVVHSQDLPLWDAPVTSIDVLSNRRAIIGNPSVDAQDVARGLVLRGVWETVVETTFLPPGTATANAAKIISLARQDDVEILAITSIDELHAMQDTIPVDKAMEDDLRSGYVLLVPRELPDESAVAGWWRVRQSTGETLGQIEGGLGGAVYVEDAGERSKATSMEVQLKIFPPPPGTPYFRPITLNQAIAPGTAAREYSILLKVASAATLALVGTSICMTYVYVRGKSADNIWTCMGVSVGAVMIPFNAILGWGIGAAIALLDIEVDFAPADDDPCPPNSICRPPGS